MPTIASHSWRMIGVAALVFTTAAGGAFPTAGAAGVASCRGESATIVGSAGTLITGTEGRDVIVADGTDVVALGGDDLICLTGHDVSDHADFVSAGPGNDIVDATDRTGRLTTYLGLGADTFTGGSGFDMVDVGLDDDFAGYSDEDKDLVDTGTGGARIRSGEGERPNADQIRFGDPRGKPNKLTYYGFQVDDGRVDFGPYGSRLSLPYRRSDFPVTVDNTRHIAVAGAQTVLDWQGTVNDFRVNMGYVPAPVVSLTFIGSEADESVWIGDVPSRLVDVRMGKGDDRLVNTACKLLTGSIFSGGGGIDTLFSSTTSADCLTTDLDLAERTLRYDTDAGSGTVEAVGFEDAGLEADRASLVGDRLDNSLTIFACWESVRAGAGDDVVIARARGDCEHRATLRGGRGDDRLGGTVLDDKVLGGLGHDIANGHDGRDTCRAEITRHCER